jgi:amino acid adenylation domain-containing protein
MHRHDPALLLHEQFEEQVKRTPAAVALQANDGSITFADLKVMTDWIAGALRAREIRNGCVVGLHLERSIAYVAAMLGVLKANNAVAPLPPSYPEGRLRDVLAFSALDAVIDHESTPLDPRLTDRVLRLSTLLNGSGLEGDAGGSDPDQAAFVLCSSGSTGTPKLIVRSHRSFFHRLNWTWDNHPYMSGETCCQKSYMTTTHAIYELFEPLLRGAPVRIVADEEVRDLERFWDTIRAGGISRLLIVPSLLQASLDMPGFVAPRLEVLVLMGEYVNPKLAGRALAAFPTETRIFSIYGSTEASSTLVCDLRESFRAGEELPLGKPISPDVRAYVLGPDLGPVRPGDVGVLHIAGRPLFTEYFRNPELTASAFVDAPEPVGRVYDTHDQVRRMADGNLQFVGRVDHTVKIRGFRVDLQEVEKTLLLHPDVSQAAVVLSEPEPGSAMLIGFFAPATVDQGTVFRVLRDRLPAYMVPSMLAGLDTVPLTASGKVDRMALLRDYAARVSTGPAGGDQSETERSVAEVWRQVLKHGSIPRGSSYFEVGGTSLTVFAVVHRLREVFGLDRAQLSDQALYEFPTLAALAALIDGLKSGSAPRVAARNSVLVTLKQGDDPSLPPFFVVASAGGTLGAYEKLARVLKTRREVIGVRDPFLWGARDPTLAIERWAALYVAAMREWQPEGPYYIGAYSSAGAYGYEMARQLRQAGQEVRLLALIDPVGMDSRDKQRFGYWAFRARFMRPSFRRMVQLGGWLRRATLGLLRVGGSSGGNDGPALTPDEFERRATEARLDRGHILSLSALLELNTGLPFTLDPAELCRVPQDRYLEVLLARVKTVAPDVDPATIESLVVQYYLQAWAQQAYRLRRYGGRIVLFEVEGPYQGLLAALLRPYVRELRVLGVAVGPQSERMRAVAERLAGPLREHYRSMRDDAFVATLAERLEPFLR